MRRCALLSTVLLACGAGCAVPGPEAAAAGGLVVEHRYAPAWWVTSICLPDDRHKTLVGRSGELLYHHPGRFHGFDRGVGFKTTVGIEVAEGERLVEQKLLDPRIPIVVTREQTPDLAIVLEAFAVTEPIGSGSGAGCGVTRTDGGALLRDWARPGPGAAVELAHIAVNWGGAIECRIPVPPGARRRVALALCEGWHDAPGQRVLALRVEGAPPRTVDTVADLGRNVAGAFLFDAADDDGDGAIAVEVAAADRAADRNAILNALWAFDAAARPDAAALLAGELDEAALATGYADRIGEVPRNDVILATVTNTGREPRAVEPALVVRSELPLDVDLDAQRVTIGGHEAVIASRAMTAALSPAPDERIVELAPEVLPPGKTLAFHVAVCGGYPVVAEPATLDGALGSRQDALRFWRDAELPYGRIQVPDRRIQALIDASIRNIWQAREVKGGLPAFQVGPTVYRGLWIVDGAFMLEAAAMLGAAEEARGGLAYTLRHQKENGAFEVLGPSYLKENGIVLWTVARHARLTQDRDWLRSVWPRVERTVGWIRELRRRTLENDTPLDDGLIPPGFVDGGLAYSDRPEYSNVLWNLLGVKAAADAAEWLGRAEQAREWRREQDDFLAVFRAAAARDLRAAPGGAAYLPNMMADFGGHAPQKAQWAFCQAVYPGQLFAPDDPLVAGNLDMLAATEQEGMVSGTGWLDEGVWNYFASFYGHAWLWRGDGRKAAACLYAMANHASPLLAWREEQSTRDRAEDALGDMPHNWASAEFIRLAVHLVALDRGSELHLLEGLPAEWTRPGMATRLDGILTPFGPLTLELRVRRDGRSADLALEPLGDPSCKRVVVHLPGAPAGAVRALDPRVPHRLRIQLPR